MYEWKTWVVSFDVILRFTKYTMDFYDLRVKF